MAFLKLVILIVILAILLKSEAAEVTTKKQRRNFKSKKSNQSEKLNPILKQASTSKVSQRSGKMNLYNTHLWPSVVNTFYRPTTTSPLYLRSPSTSSSSSMFYPLHWGKSFINPSSFTPLSTLRRSDSDSLSSSPTYSSQSSMLAIGNSQIPTLFDMSSFTSNAGLMDNPFSTSSQNLWPIGGTIKPPTAKPKFNLFNSFNYKDDGGLLVGFLNHFI